MNMVAYQTASQSQIGEWTIYRIVKSISGAHAYYYECLLKHKKAVKAVLVIGDYFANLHNGKFYLESNPVLMTADEIANAKSSFERYSNTNSFRQEKEQEKYGYL